MRRKFIDEDENNRPVQPPSRPLPNDEQHRAITTKNDVGASRGNSSGPAYNIPGEEESNDTKAFVPSETRMKNEKMIKNEKKEGNNKNRPTNRRRRERHIQRSYEGDDDVSCKNEDDSCSSLDSDLVPGARAVPGTQRTGGGGGGGRASLMDDQVDSIAVVDDDENLIVATKAPDLESVRRQERERIFGQAATAEVVVQETVDDNNDTATTEDSPTKKMILLFCFAAIVLVVVAVAITLAVVLPDDTTTTMTSPTNDDNECIRLTLEMDLPCNVGEDIEFTLTDESTLENIWDECCFKNGSRRTFSACLQPTQCYDLSFISGFDYDDPSSPQQQGTKTQQQHEADPAAATIERTESVESRIVGGTQASPGEYPFFVHWARCGASLIHDDIVLSSAFCDTDDITQNTMFIGAYKLESTDAGAEVRGIAEKRIHPFFDRPTALNDVMVIKLDQPSTKQPIPLNVDPSIPYDNEQLTMIGMGFTSEDATSLSTYLQEVNLNAVDHDTCIARYGADGIFEDEMLCAGGEGEGGICGGDSGSPLIDSNGVQVGIGSFSAGCAQPGNPDGFVRISGVIEWINEQICDLSSNPPDFCPTATGTQNVVPVRVTIFPDNSPSELGLTIRSIRDNSIVIDYPFGTFTGIFGLYTETFNLVAGDEYRLELRDSAGNGFCCNDGEGRFEISALLSDGEVLLSEGEGAFTYSLAIGFSVPKLPTPSPTSSPTGLPTTESGCGNDDEDTPPGLQKITLTYGTEVLYSGPSIESGSEFLIGDGCPKN